VGNVRSSTVTGEASSSNVAEIAGIKAVDLQAGLLGGANLISGIGSGSFNTSSAAVTGPSTATSDVMVGGLIGDGNTAKLDGNVTGIATLTNTVLATTVSGSATATATSSAVGIGGYDIQILKDGVITASATSNTSSIANTVTV
jgi:hypothetical protein